MNKLFCFFALVIVFASQPSMAALRDTSDETPGNTYYVTNNYVTYTTEKPITTLLTELDFILGLVIAVLLIAILLKKRKTMSYTQQSTSVQEEVSEEEK